MKEGNTIFTLDKSVIEGKLSKDSKRYLEYCLVFIGNILERQARLSKEDQKDKFITFSFERRKQIMPKYYISSIEDDLIRLGIIEKDSSYSKEGEKAQGFRLTEEFFTNESLLYSIEDKMVNKRLSKYNDASTLSKSIDLSSSLNQDLVYQSSKFQLDVPKYISSSTSEYNVIGDNVDSNNHYVYQFLETSESKEGISPKLSVLGTVLNQKDFYSRKDNEDRFYSKWQILPKQLRQFLKLTDNPLGLMQVDISCSQPAILGGIASLEYYKKPKDLTDYITCVSSGKLYDIFSDYTREKAKHGLMILLFGEKIFGEFKPLEKRFQESFPTVYSYLTEIKKEDYRNSSKLLRKTEAKLILDGVCKSLMKIKSEDFAYMPIHDALIVPENYCRITEELIKSEFMSNFGFECNVKTKRVTEGKTTMIEYLNCPTAFKFNGYEYDLLCASGYLSVYSQKSNSKVCGYEIHKNVFKKNTLPNGQIVEKWFKPSTSQWGKFGFTKYSVQGAIDKFSELINE